MTKSSRSSIILMKRKKMELTIWWPIPVETKAMKKKTKSMSGQIVRRDTVRWHVTVTRAIQLIRNKRCQRQTDENRCRVQMLFIVKHVCNPRRMLFKRSSECYRDTCFMRIPGHGKFVRLSRQFWTHFISLAVIYRQELNGLYEH